MTLDYALHVAKISRLFLSDGIYNTLVDHIGEKMYYKNKKAMCNHKKKNTINTINTCI